MELQKQSGGCVSSTEHQVNKQSVADLSARLAENKKQAETNIRLWKEANENLEMKALEQEIRRREIGDDFDEEPIRATSYNGPGDCYVANCAEALDRLSLLAEDTVREGYVCRGLLVPVAAFDPAAECAKGRKIRVWCE